MNTHTEARRTGAYLISEAAGTRSRDAIIINATAGKLLPGQLLRLVTASNAATATAAGGNTGNGTMGPITVGNDAITGNYLLEITEAAANAGVFTLTDPNGDVVGAGNVAQAFSGGGLAFTLADGSTDFAVGDSFALAVNAGLGEWTPYTGTGTATGILYAAVDATEQDVPAVAHVRDCEVDAAELTGLDDDAVADLLALGIIVRGL